MHLHERVTEERMKKIHFKIKKKEREWKAEANNKTLVGAPSQVKDAAQRTNTFILTATRKISRLL